jgi:hypothetical protein
MPTHLMLTSNPAISLNQIFSRAGIPKRFRSKESAMLYLPNPHKTCPETQGTFKIDEMP